MLKSFGGLVAAAVFGIFATVPSSSNYTLKAFDFGNGGGSSSSTNFKLNAITNGQGSSGLTSATYKIGPGLMPTQNANVPQAPTFTNPSSYYNRLRLVINTSNNPSDTRYAIAISPDNFVTTYYVQVDNTIALTLSMANYQTYTAWGGASGVLILGLQPDTTYKAKIKALQGNFTETSFGPEATVATVQPSITFSVATSASSTPPFTVSFSNLSPGSVNYTDADPLLSLTTNAVFGGAIYINDSNSGLKSISSGGYTLTSATADLGSAAKGYGAQVINLSQVSGGPITAANPFDSASDNVGGITNTLQPLAQTSSPVTTASVTTRIKAKTDVNTPAASDYNDLLTFIASMVF